MNDSGWSGVHTKAENFGQQFVNYFLQFTFNWLLIKRQKGGMKNMIGPRLTRGCWALSMVLNGLIMSEICICQQIMELEQKTKSVQNNPS